ncbi:MAG: tripartite tricarboxylate transporter substrate binding protein [Burkholderiales bacterium]|nr:tripartite tricarboxylate transporter substrate binding protein [Burkholderiales bacterium]
MHGKCGRLLITLCTALAATSFAAIADTYPNRPVRFVVPAPPGGAPDALARQTGQKLADALGQSMVIDNRAGGNGIIGSEIAARAVPDGYTIVMGYAGPFSINPALYPKLPYDPVRDFVPLALIATGQNVLVVHPSVAARSVKQLIALAKSKPGQLNYASGGTGQSSHLSMELFTLMAGIKMVHIPYKGAGPAMADVIGGQVALQFLALPPAIPQIKSGKLIGLGVSGSKRATALPGVPTIAESGLAGYEVLTWYGAFAPAKVPKPIAARLATEFTTIVGSQEMQDLFQKQGLDGGSVSADDFGKYLRAEVEKWRKVVKDANIKLEH